MSEIRYGQVEGKGTGREYPVAASQYFHRLGGKFVYISQGHLNLCASTNVTINGWAEVPKHTAGADSWVSSSTAGNDSVFMVYAEDAVFEMPYHGTVVATSLLNKGVGITNATTYTSADVTPTAATKQWATLVAAATPLKVVDVDADNRTVFVKLKGDRK